MTLPLNLDTARDTLAKAVEGADDITHEDPHGIFARARFDRDIRAERDELLRGLGRQRNPRFAFCPLLENRDLHRIRKRSAGRR